jgi:hypothetical protein
VNKLHDANPIPYQRALKLYSHCLGSFEFATTHVAIQASHSQSTFPHDILELSFMPPIVVEN